MDSSHQQPNDDTPGASVAEIHPPSKRPSVGGDEPPSKKIRPSVEVPAFYSDAVRKKLASTTRTGQACDRCKERKMKCDTDPTACQPCRQKNLRCYTTDRVTGQSRERGQTDRAETELNALRQQNAAYYRKYGPLESGEYQTTTHSPVPDSTIERPQHFPPTSPSEDKKRACEPADLPDLEYVGWCAQHRVEALHNGPVNGTNVDVLDGFIDIANWPCEAVDDHPMHELNVLNMSRSSVLNTMTGYQNVIDARFPPKDQAIQDATTFLIILSQYVPILHSPSFLDMVNRIYDQPNTVSQPERVQLAVVLAIVEQQNGLRNHREAAEKFAASNHHIHYALTYYRELLRERTLASMQALALILVHFRNLPKPSYTWGFGHDILMKVMEAEYHRDPDKIELPPAENNVLAKELRKRVFHSILGICVTTGWRIGRLVPWHFTRMDVPLPMAIRDAEISRTGLTTTLSGSSDFWPCLQLAKLLPLLTEMYTYVTSVRRPEKDYVRTVEILHSKIDAWRRDWDEAIRGEDKHVNLLVATLLVEGWAAEYTLHLYHPSLCTSRSPETMDKHLEICHKQAQRLLKTFHTLSSRYKGVDFTWHSIVAYALGFGVTLHVYQRKKGRLTTAQFESMKNELKGWMSLMAYADLVLRTKNYLQHVFEPRVQRVLAEWEETMRAMSEHSYSNTGTPTPGILNHRPFVKADPSPRPSPLSVVSNSMSVHSEQPLQDVGALQYPQTQSVTNNQQWSHPSSYASQPGNGTPTYSTHASSATHTYPAYSTAGQQYSTLPTSLAPLLNDHSTGYMTYPPSTNPQHEMMIFQPQHYTDGPVTMMWPYITLPPQDQGQQHDTQGTMKPN